ncbi:hypothetical protein HDU99_003929 [Rhizoclosmatium hyalinum]|nr:hypothetical protein HDU99_003929 [Rhizoclosmatium hyalinum]
MKLPQLTLVSAIIALIGWILLVIGIVLVGGVQNVTGFYLAYFAVLIAYVIAAEVGYVKMNRIGIVGLSAVGFSWIVGFCDTGAQYSKVSGLSSNIQSGYGLIAAGSILMSMPFIYWIWAYGEPSSKKTGYV